MANMQDKKWIDMLVAYFDKLSSKYLRNKKDMAELQIFMQDELNLYNEDGSLTEAYKRKIREMEGYVVTNPVDETLEEEHMGDEESLEVVRGIIDFVDERKELMDDYKRKSLEDEQNFDEQEWIRQNIKKSSWTEEEIGQKMELESDMTEDDILEMLKDDTVNQSMKDTLN